MVQGLYGSRRVSTVQSSSKGCRAGRQNATTCSSEPELARGGSNRPEKSLRWDGGPASQPVSRAASASGHPAQSLLNTGRADMGTAPGRPGRDERSLRFWRGQTAETQRRQVTHTSSNQPATALGPQGARPHLTAPAKGSAHGEEAVVPVGLTDTEPSTVLTLKHLTLCLMIL